MFSLRDTFMTVYKGRLYPNYWDMIALFLALSGIILLAVATKQMSAPYELGQTLPISLDPRYLPEYCGRTVMRMLIAMIISLLFTMTFATWAAKSRRAGRIIIPIIDVLQSVPILGFLSITIVGFIHLFPGSMWGPECASIFAVFTSQAWNMALGFYQTVRSVPAELNEAAEMFHLSAWQKFWRIDVPFSMPGLLWNMMMSMSAGWFFVVASEAITVNSQQILLPGIGSYIAVAIKAMDVKAIFYAIFAMLAVILIYDQFIFRPLIAWADKFKSEQVGEEKEAHSWLVDILHRTRLLRYLGAKVAVFLDACVNISFLRSKPPVPQPPARRKQKDVMIGWIYNISLLTAIVCAIIFTLQFIYNNLSFGEIEHVFFLGLITALRVFCLVIICTLIWVPIGVWIGMRPSVAEVMQPIAQILAAFPAYLLFPLVVFFIVNFHLNVNVWVTPLMILGAQWYILFNVIAGASVIPKDLLQVADNLGVSRWLRWRRLILPGIFPYYITGAITAVGGAWNASIVAEVVSWGNTKLVATGLGAYITESTDSGNFIHTALGIGMMCILVLIFNRLIWRPLYVLAESKYTLS